MSDKLLKIYLYENSPETSKSKRNYLGNLRELLGAVGRSRSFEELRSLLERKEDTVKVSFFKAT